MIISNKKFKIPTREPTSEGAKEPEVAKEPAIDPEVATEPIKATKATKVKTKRKQFSLKLREKLLDEIKNEETNINEQIFNEVFNYHYSSLLVKDLYEHSQNKNGKIVKNINESLINLRNSINSNETAENENPKKIVNIVEKILDFNKQQKGKGHPLVLAKHIKILTPKQMLQILPVVLAQVKAGNKSENLLNEIRQIIYSLYQEKEVTKKVYNSIMNSIKL